MFNQEDGLVGSLSVFFERARKKKNVTIEDVAHCLKVSCSQVRHLENGDYCRLPGETFVRGFIRSYCRLLDVSSQEVMDHYNASLSQNVSNDLENPREVKHTFISFILNRFNCIFDFVRSPWILFSTLFFLAVLGAGLGRLVWLHYHQDFLLDRVLPEMPNVTPTSQTNLLNETLSELDIRVSHATWMIVHDSRGHVVFSEDMFPGKAYKVHARSPLSVIAGNVSSLNMIYNGRPLGKPRHVTKSTGKNYVQFYLN
ncbi:MULTISPECIES: helix-turn-helix domain-containing protein [Candidatus Ichthyocystis]|uniref:Putative DNA binding protein, HTH and DUF4115 domains n=1 Tax=Candidatus Ichthyocystis hellenicum TaxID=1561003 RepID=A0A0S4M1W2_9BURK|nr:MULTISPECIES: helix-turn-helix domain-containing protein [Ichthyocystis]CUT17765.1 putative DNA binding protein, HTH and DUF4115 domains [Candidatus Ichthyocystis hellenicum]